MIHVNDTRYARDKVIFYRCGSDQQAM